jgi:two-component system OmpR family sensor kinase
MDRGQGFPAGLEQNVFQPFWRADSSRSRESGGTGLGMAVVAAIMRSHGGDVSASAREGGGALVELRFPPRT